MEDYIKKIRGLISPSFESIRTIAFGEISGISPEEDKVLYNSLNRGLALLDDHKAMCKYLHGFGPMHKAKLQDAFKELPQNIFDHPFDVIDWGCGQAMGTVNLFDHIKKNGKTLNVRKVTLIEPAVKALEKAKLHASIYLNEAVELVTIDRFFESITKEDLRGDSAVPVIHIFSNILDVAEIDLKYLSALVDATVQSDNYLVCVGPLNPGNHRIDAFLKYFDTALIKQLFEKDESSYFGKWTFKCRIFKLEANEVGHLIPIEYFPHVQFQAGYLLDVVKDTRKNKPLHTIVEKYSHFEVAAPFDLGASVYEDVHPVLAVLNNIIVRGVPTRASVFLEQCFSDSFGYSELDSYLGGIRYPLKNGQTIDQIESLLNSEKIQISNLNQREKELLQMILSPIAVARFHKVLIEAIITGHLSLESKAWRLLIEEEDVPFAALAVEDFKQLFSNLIGLTSAYEDLKLPEIQLTILGEKTFQESPLHLNNQVYTSHPKTKENLEFDMVFTLSMIKAVDEEIEKFSKYKVKNNCYFNTRNIQQIRSKRQIYTSSLIYYKRLVFRDQRGNYQELNESVSHLRYFLQLFFRKENFRPGQLPILDRALQNQPVIGLLPTGGGKSLTYQIPALLQPGITLIVDPLKSLMKDQYDGLISAGIDSCTYINGSLSPEEKRLREQQLESSQLQFMFLSPERLSILSFRKRLEHMYSYNVYFSYGVIDEVHCVSEWGHDFRNSYLHLGRNLYNYVKAKEGHISLLGLTATASFDVLADVERELSGNGAFDLDSDTIVRFENSNRLELQYKIEKVPVEFEEDSYYDKYGKMSSHLPKARNITNSWVPFKSKSAYLKDFIAKVPLHHSELQKPKVLERIFENFSERNGEVLSEISEVKVDLPYDFYSANSVYDHAGIIFCPHAKKSDLSVEVNSKNLKKTLNEHVGSFTGQDDDDISIENLESFRDDKMPIMVATKAFGMGIDKPNVRFTVNMNYSSSLEAFVQEAGRSGRDRRTALSVILVSDYRLARVNSDYPDQQFPFSIIKNKWFYEQDLNEILTFYGIQKHQNHITVATPTNDIVKLHCTKDNRMFGFNDCSLECSEFKKCNLRKVSPETKGWKTEFELIQELRSQGLSIGKSSFQYLNPDYGTVMYFFGSTFKGDIIEKRFMNSLLNEMVVSVEEKDDTVLPKKNDGFLAPLLLHPVDHRLVIFVTYTDDNYADISKAIYRMCCIELIDDFTQDYSKKQFRIEAVRRDIGGYFDGLERFLLRYYTADRAAVEIEKVKDWSLNAIIENKTAEEIYKCLGYLTEFVYDKISEKRKRAIDDMRNFCMVGLQEGRDWTELNEELKDFLFYYFNSKFAKIDFVTDEGEPFSLMNDTEEGKYSDAEVLLKYLRVIDDNVVGIGTPLDNVKHLYGAVRLISRSLTDENPTLALLESFCLAYLQIKENENLKNQLVSRYSTGMMEFHDRIESPTVFWKLFNTYNQAIAPYLGEDQLGILIEETRFLIHAKQLKNIKSNYLA